MSWIITTDLIYDRAITITSSVPTTGPSVYNSYVSKWSTFPDTAEAWVARAKEVSGTLAQDAEPRDQENKSPRAEITLPKHSSLLKLLCAKKYGGGEQPSFGIPLGYHLFCSTTTNVVGTPEQIERTHELIITNNYFVGGAANTRDSDLKINPDGGNIISNGAKSFNTGGVVSDLTVLEGVLEGTDSHIFPLVENRQPGIQLAHFWHNIGLGLTE
ncbi:acyl-CoA dehydrogenase/oxidase [Aspergillus falconensis]